MAIEYKTEGKVLIECPKGHTKHVALTWVKGDTKVLMHSGNHTIELSPNQLKELADLSDRICSDLKS